MMFQLPGGVAGRMALRELLRHKGRSALVAVLVALPVAVAVALSVVASPQVQDQVSAQLANGVGRVTALQAWDGTCQQYPELSWDTCAESDSEQQATAAKPDWTAVDALPQQKLVEWHAPVTVDADGEFPGDAYVTDLSSPLAANRWFGTLQAPGADQVVLTAQTSQQTERRVGDVVTIKGTQYRVSGIVRTDVWDASVVVGPDHPLARALPVADREQVVYLYGAMPTLAQARELNGSGLAVVTDEGLRRVSSMADDFTMMQGLLVLAALLAALLTGTIAGAAFAIGLRQQRRSLALLAASGAPARVLQRTMVRQGLLLGLVGAVLGTLVGIAAGFGAVALMNRGATGSYLQPRLGPLVIIGSMLIAVVSAIVAAWVPSRQIARQDVLTAVRDSEAAQAPARAPWSAAGLVALALVVALVGPRVWPSGGGRYAGTVPVETVIGPGCICVALLFFGLLLAIPWLLDRVGRRAAGPLAVRMALRDGTRNRGRASACVAASLAITSLVAALLVANQSMDQTDTDHYESMVPAGVVTIPVDATAGQSYSPATIKAVTAVVADLFGEPKAVADAVTPVECQRAGDSRWCSPAVQAQVCLDDSAGQAPVNASVTTRDEPGVACGRAMGVPALVYTPELFQVLAGRDATAAEQAALAKGVVLITPDGGLGGKTVLEGWTGEGSQLKVAALGVPELKGYALASEATLRHASPTASLQPHERLVQTGIDPDGGDVADLTRALTKARLGAIAQRVSLEQGPHGGYADFVKWFGIVGAGLMLSVAAVASALALRDQRDSHAGLAAIGASTWTLRGMAAVQTLVSVGLGVALGMVIGSLPLVAMIAATRGGVSLGIPWGWLVGLLVGVPLVAALTTFVVARPPRARAVRVD